MSDIVIKKIGASPDSCAALGSLLVEVVAGGGSVSFMHPLPFETAYAFWVQALAAAGRGERIVFGAYEGDELVATVTLLLDLPPNQAHRAEIAKMMTRPGRRGRGIASALLTAAEQAALARNRTLLVLDTASEGGASTLYERHGFTLAGEIPDYAHKPHGGLTGTRLYWKRLAPIDH
ncbi:MAG: GNAT family N-acetyltransferase [Pseudomonadota bacterium]